jgi:hypothetical protein
MNASNDISLSSKAQIAQGFQNIFKINSQNLVNHNNSGKSLLNIFSKTVQ